MRVYCVIVFTALNLASGMAQVNPGPASVSGVGPSRTPVDRVADVDESYVVGVGDVLLISVQSKASYSQKYRMDFEVPVEKDGSIYVDLVGTVPAAGKTIARLRDELADTLKSVIRRPWVTLRVKEYNSQKVTVFGEAQNGIYPLKRPTRIAEFISSIGGTTDKADLSSIKVVRANGEVVVVDLTKFIYSHDLEQDIYLKGGDLILIPDVHQRKVLVLGEVRSPGTIFMKSKLNIVEALVQAGGYTPEAKLNDVKVIRFVGDKPRVLTANLQQVLKNHKKKSNIVLENGDVIFVPRKGDAFKGVSKLLGTVIPALQTILLIKALN